MRIKSIELNNIGVYEGISNQYNFKTDTDKNIILIIGENGAGKTTLLESIKLGLYGPMVIGLTSYTSKEYQRLVISSITDSIDKNSNQITMFDIKPEISIAIEFSINIDFKINSYKIIRSWELINKDKAKENVFLYENGILLSETKKRHVLDKLYKKIPFKLFNIFWFDGEKSEFIFSFDHNFSEMMDLVFNIDIVNSLKKDMLKFLKGKADIEQLSEKIDERIEIDNSINEIKSKINNMDKKINRYKESIEKTNDEINDLEDEILLCGGKYTDELKKIIKKRDNIVKKREDLRRQNKDLVIEKLPMMLLKKQLLEIKNKLILEQKAFKNRIFKSRIEEIFESKIFNDAVNCELSKYIKNINSEDELFSINPFDFNKLLEKIDCVLVDNPKDIIRNARNIDRLTENLNETKLLISKNETEDIKQMKIELDELKEKLIREKIKVEIYEEDNRDLNAILDINVEHISKIDKQIKDFSKSKNIGNVVNSINLIIDKFSTEIKIKKIKELNIIVTEIFKKLIRKDSFIGKIEFDVAGNFKAYNVLGKQLTKKMFSAGETQLLMLSIIYGFVHLSNMPIPLVFDTLFGRLDDTHKNNIINEYLPNLSEQVIILATDTEVDAEKERIISKYVSNKYNLTMYEENLAIKN